MDKRLNSNILSSSTIVNSILKEVLRLSTKPNTLYINPEDYAQLLEELNINPLNEFNQLYQLTIRVRPNSKLILINE